MRSGLRMVRDLFLGGLTCVGLSAPTAEATPLLSDQGSFVSDSVTGLDWLKLTDTNTWGKSYNTVSGAFGGTLAGWSYASLADVTKLFEDASQDAGFPESGPFDFSNPGIVTHNQWVIATYLSGLLGQTGALTVFLTGSGTGLTSDLNGYGGHALATFSWVGDSTNGLGFLVVPYGGLDYPTFANDNGSSPLVSSFLIRISVRNPDPKGDPTPVSVPEPGSLFVIGTGLVTLSTIRRRSRMKT